ncbi:MAG TPA: hypothetical protein ENG05_02730 [Acidilobales archaeon]|nr:hypothetical protein [Acidilobales archaeon]
MGRRSRKRFKRRIKPVRRLPRIFQCPACGLPTLTVELKTYTREDGEERKVALIRCYNPECGLRATMKDLPSIYAEVDAYAKFLDAFSEGAIEVTYERGEGVEEEG